MNKLHLNLRQQRLGQDGGRAFWEVVVTEAEYDCASTALLLCDVWNKHWSRGASERVDAMVPRMNEVVAAARASGVQIVHAPSSTMEFYAGTPARQRVLDDRAGRPAARPRAGGPAAAGRFQRRGLRHRGRSTGATTTPTGTAPPGPGSTPASTSTTAPTWSATTAGRCSAACTTGGSTTC